MATTWLGHLPGFLSALGVLAALAALATVAVRQVAERPEADLPSGPTGHAPSCAISSPDEAGAQPSVDSRPPAEARGARVRLGGPELAGREGS